MPLPRLIPCLDVAAGRVVKGVRFQGLRDVGDPVELGAAYSDAGADELVFLDVAATIEGRETLVDLVRRVAERLAIPFTVGGGIRTVADAEALLEAGADKVSVNSAALATPDLVTDARRAARLAGRRPRDRRDRRRRPLARRRRRDRAPRGRVGARGRGARRRRDPPHLDRHRRHPRRLRPRADGRSGRRGLRAGDRLRRRRVERGRAPPALEGRPGGAARVHPARGPARAWPLRDELRGLGVQLRDAA